MKKLAKLAALLAAGALVFGFAACSGDDDNDVAVEGVTLNPTELTVTLGGEPVKLTAIVLPEDADNKEVFWASDNEDAATVDENGVVTAVKAGTATITVTTEDGGYTAACVVTVSDGTGNGGNGGGG
ncbi:MAG: Ig domain-containing protein, partial [Treponema sp.]|nr:Ig domain-containing protein [Treponema sp.]